MNIDLKFTVDYDGNPCLEFKVPRRRESMEDRLLDVFVKKIKENGMRLVDVALYSSGLDGHSEYRIIANYTKNEKAGS